MRRERRCAPVLSNAYPFPWWDFRSIWDRRLFFLCGRFFWDFLWDFLAQGDEHRTDDCDDCALHFISPLLVEFSVNVGYFTERHIVERRFHLLMTGEMPIVLSVEIVVRDARLTVFDVLATDHAFGEPHWSLRMYSSSFSRHPRLQNESVM